MLLNYPMDKMASEDMSNLKKQHITEKIGITDVLNLLKGRAPEEEEEYRRTLTLPSCRRVCRLWEMLKLQTTVH